MVRIVKNNVGRKWLELSKITWEQKWLELSKITCHLPSVFFCFLFLRFYEFSWFSHPATTANDFLLKKISIPNLIHFLFCPILFHVKEPVFSFYVECQTREMLVQSYNVFGMTRPLSGIEPGTSRTRCQHSTTGLSRTRKIAFSKISCFSKSVKFPTYLLNQLILFMIHGIGISVFDLYFNF